MELHPDTNGSSNSQSDGFINGNGTCLPASKVPELTKLNSLENASSQSLFKIVHKILDDTIENKKEDVPDRVASVLKKLIQMTEHQIAKQVDNFKKQNNVYKTREEKYQFKFKVFENLLNGAAQENELIMDKLQFIKSEKRKMEDIKKLEDVELIKLRKEKNNRDLEISKLKQELEIMKDTYESRCVQLETNTIEVESELKKKITNLENLLNDSRKKVKELEKFTESKFLRWKKKERGYKNFMDFQSGSLKELKMGSESIKLEVLKTQQIYTEEINQFGIKIQGLVDAAQNYHTVLTENRKLYNEVQDLKGNIRVYCRIRPFLKGQSQKQTTIEYIGDNGELIVTNPSKQIKETHRLFKFNKVFSPSATQEDVFVDTQPLIRSVLDGYNVCIFAYGQTGSGKTYTMTGPNVSCPEDWGVNYRALNDLFHLSQTRRSSFEYEIGVQMVEIYNEQVRDLLSTVPDASMHPVTSTANVLELMNLGLTNRAVGATALNERSSRSHSVLTVHVRGLDLETNAVLRGNLHLVDLAGSERVDRSEATGDRLREAQHINKSLSALGDVIFALAQKSQHVPYRNSKLTQVLQSSLGGQAKTLMFVQLNPDVESFSETISTLKFAERVSGVELGAARSNKDARGVRELMEQVGNLKDALSKKDEELARLRVGKTGENGLGLQMNGTPIRGDCFSESSSPRSIHEDDIDILGLGQADDEERLSDISDGGLSMGTETDGSLSSIVELTLFPGAVKPPVDHHEKPIVPAKLPRPPQKAASSSSRKPVQTGSSSSQRLTAPPSRPKGVPRVSLGSSAKKSTTVKSAVRR
ncbi:hypothetical protein L2E82_06310 [Cichorium intybus]|uniref:Uncharacterized protein n=1 Tax=Cichorium intybus TaxID=13427 RepID=A0ACB9HAW4_CICIN|nr:hypothetical protein L2E82_06310 [Cichorium intybus]